MSVIVKNMEMPSGCQSCDFSDDETRFCKAAKEYIPMVGKPWFCPLVELPEKHGRLGDLDELKTSFADSINECKKWIKELEENGDNETLPLANQTFCTFVEAALRLKSIPTIVEAEGE